MVLRIYKRQKYGCGQCGWRNQKRKWERKIIQKGRQRYIDGNHGIG